MTFQLQSARSDLHIDVNNGELSWKSPSQMAYFACNCIAASSGNWPYDLPTKLLLRANQALLLPTQKPPDCGNSPQRGIPCTREGHVKPSAKACKILLLHQRVLLNAVAPEGVRRQRPAWRETQICQTIFFLPAQARQVSNFVCSSFPDHPLLLPLLRFSRVCIASNRAQRRPPYLRSACTFPPITAGDNARDPQQQETASALHSNDYSAQQHEGQHQRFLQEQMQRLSVAQTENDPLAVTEGAQQAAEASMPDNEMTDYIQEEDEEEDPYYFVRPQQRPHGDIYQAARVGDTERVR